MALRDANDILIYCTSNFIVKNIGKDVKKPRVVEKKTLKCFKDQTFKLIRYHWNALSMKLGEKTQFEQYLNMLYGS